MSASQIPNLLETLRASRGTRGGRGRRNDTESPRKEPDKVVQQTDVDAAGSRASAVQLGYLDDDFAGAFSVLQEPVRRMPIINRGTYVRTTSIDRLVEQFLDKYEGQYTQIVSLGAGTDTRFFRLVQKRPELSSTLRYLEIDFPSTTSTKIQAIQQSPLLNMTLRSILKQGPDGLSDSTQEDYSVSADKTALSLPAYTILPLDLRTLISSTNTDNIEPKTPSLSPTTPTLILSECCLTYLPAEQSSAILNFFTSNLVPEPCPIEIILYEPIHPHDAFGRTMLSNLSARGISMPGLEAYSTLKAHKARLKDVGFVDGQEAWEIKDIWERWIDEHEKDRLRGLEMVDEEEEWMLLAGHYGIVVGVRNDSKESLPAR